MTHKFAIICVDDELTILKSIQAELQRALGSDYLIELAQDAQEALEVIDDLTQDQYQVAVVIADYIMPGLKGDDLLIQIHAQNPRILKIMLTGQADADAVGHVVNEAHLYRYMTKPWNNHDLVTTVREALRSFNQDIKLEEQNTVLTHLNQFLEQKVDERTAALQAANLQLQQLNQELTRSNEALEQFTAMVSHDLRQPLQSIVGFAKLLKLQFGNRLEPPALAYVNKIITAGDRLHQMLNDLLTYAQVGMENHAVMPVNCTSILNEAIANLQWAIDDSHAEIHIEPLPTLVGNTSQLLQLFQNLISNAIKFSRVGVSPRIRIWGQQVDQCWQFGIQDNGQGIPAQECDRIFKLFHRVRQDDDSIRGSGIGLATCQKIVERHGGKIWAESCLGEGTTLFFTIPCKTPAS